MSIGLRKAAFAVIFAAALAWPQAARGQSACLSADEVKAMLARMRSGQEVAPNNKLSEELVKLAEKEQIRFRDAVQENYKPEEFAKRVGESRRKSAVRFCELLKKFGWPTTKLVSKEAATAAFFLLNNSAPFELQARVIPLLLVAAARDEIDKADLAGLIDRMRVTAGRKQVFGTQASVVNGFLVISPIAGEDKVDERRKAYGLPPLAEYIAYLQRTYQIPLVKSPVAPASQVSGALKSSAAGIGNEEGEEASEVLRVDTNLVSLNVSVYSNRLKTHVSSLVKEDFQISEDGREEAVTFFAATDMPFDLVLLLDLSGSTAGKRDLIRKSTRRFIESARPSDRLSIVTFSDAPHVVVPLTEDRERLLQGVKAIEGTGGSNIWDALKFTLDEVVGPKSFERRRAVVLMSDGVDGALLFYAGRGSKTSFADLIETVRRNDTLVIPIYVDTETPFSMGIYENARKTLAMLADESGGLYYRARKIEDLNGVYEQVLTDLGKIYSLGYTPTNAKRDGSWRAVKVQTPKHPDLLTRTRPGYYAN